METQFPYLAPEEWDIHVWREQLAEFLKEGPPTDPFERIQYQALKVSLHNALVAYNKREREAEMKLRELRGAFEKFNSWRIAYRRKRQAENAEVDTYFLSTSSLAAQAAKKQELLDRVANHKARMEKYGQVRGKYSVEKGKARKAERKALKEASKASEKLLESGGRDRPGKGLW